MRHFSTASAALSFGRRYIRSDGRFNAVRREGAYRSATKPQVQGEHETRREPACLRPDLRMAISQLGLRRGHGPVT